MLVGLIWTIQVVQYPLFRMVGTEMSAIAWKQYHTSHTKRITVLVFPLMSSEMALAGWMFLYPPEGVGRWVAGMALAAVVLIWASTFFLQVPLHAKLDRQFHDGAARLLVSTNVLRTALWSFKLLLLCWVAHAR